MKRAIAATLLNTTGILSLARKLLRWNGVICLNYHRIGNGTESNFDRGLWSADAEEFEAQVSLLKSHFHLICPEDLPDVISRRTGQHVLITFDDGYLDNYTTAFPILKRHQVRATFFVTTGFIDRSCSSWWDEIAWMVRTSDRSSLELPDYLSTPVILDEPDREQAVRALLKVYKLLPSESTDSYLQAVAKATGSGRYCFADTKDFWMTWDMLKEMRMAGMSIGGHTVSHPILAQMPGEQQWREISECGRRLEEELNEPMLSFSYPNGNLHSFNEDTRNCLSKAGVGYAFSYYGGFRTFKEWDNCDIRRVPVEPYVTRDWFRAIVMLPRVFSC